MTTKVLGLVCSPRDKSNSLQILEHCFPRSEKSLEGFVGEIIDLKTLNIIPCNACGVCGKNKQDGHFMDCIYAQQDDVQGVLDAMIAADAIIVATPVYYGMPSDLFSKFIMRTRVLRHQDFQLANKPVGVIAIAGRRSGGAETTIMQTWLPFIRNGCLIVGNGDKTCQYGAMCWAGPAGAVLSDDWGVEQSMQTIERAYHIARIVKAGEEALDYKNPMTFCYKSGGR